MSKKNDTPFRVVWQLNNDGIEPSPAPFGFIGRNPVQVVIPPNASARINLHVVANVPLLAFPTRTRADDLTVKTIIQPGEEIVVDVSNGSPYAALSIEDKEGLVCLHPLVANAVGIVG